MVALPDIILPLYLSLSPDSYCNDSDAVAGVIRARLNAAISESPQADQDQAQVSQNWLEIVLIVRPATRWLIAPPPPPLAAILPWRNQWSRNGLLLLQNIVINVWGVLSAHSIGHQIIVKWSPSRFPLRVRPSSTRTQKINTKIFWDQFFYYFDTKTLKKSAID